ncbi:hypothetical protein GCM10010206_63790 [Streptomyces cinerochromogenes]|nr:hypothetical protein GCM10010206_63790 [Streptomyces cinerochromogenes]
MSAVSIVHVHSLEGDKVPEEWIRALVADFGSKCKRLRVSDTEASISPPVAKLV